MALLRAVIALLCFSSARVNPFWYLASFVAAFSTALLALTSAYGEIIRQNLYSATSLSNSRLVAGASRLLKHRRNSLTFAALASALT